MFSTWGFDLKNIILLLVLGGALGACASQEPVAETGGAKSEEAVAATDSDATGLPERKQVCKYKRTRGTGSVMERVCKWVDVD